MDTRFSMSEQSEDPARFSTGSILDVEANRKSGPPFLLTDLRNPLSDWPLRRRGLRIDEAVVGIYNQHARPSLRVRVLEVSISGGIHGADEKGYKDIYGQ